tara:strand:- start:265 stop:1545 length:1281 start_codon:yes stop_codon:yes gene_type:complete
MDLKQSVKTASLNKSIYINLRWIGILGQFITINSVKFIFGFEFNFYLSNLIILVGVLSNFYLMFIYRKPVLSNLTSFNFLFLDILQLSALLYLSGGILNPFSIFLLIPSVFASSNLNIRTNIALILITLASIIILTFYYYELPKPLNEYSISLYYYYAIPLALIIALFFLNYFAFIFGQETNLRKDALDKIQEVISKEHELVSLGGQAAAAAHSFGTPLSTIKIISHDLFDQFKDNNEVKKDLELLVSQVNRCNEILKKLTLNPAIEDDFIDKNKTLYDYINEIVNSFKEISKKNFNIDKEQDSNSFEILKSVEIVYGLRNFIGNANKFSNENIYIAVKSDSQKTEITIEDDGPGIPKDIIKKIGEPYIKTLRPKDNKKTGLGLGIFIGKTLLEKNSAKIIIRNSETRGGAEVKIEWENKNLKKLV